MANSNDRLWSWVQLLGGAWLVYRGVKQMQEPAKALGLLGAGGGEGSDSRILTQATTVAINSIEERMQYIVNMTRDSSFRPEVREAVASVLSKKCGDKWCVKEKDPIAEIKALHWAVKDPRSPNAVRYTRDHIFADQYVRGDKTLSLRIADCLPRETLVLGEGYVFREVGDVRPGDVIMGDGGWTQVTQTWDKGVQPILRFELNNGCALRCTPDHKVFIVPRRAHNGRVLSLEESRTFKLKRPGLRTDAVEVRARDVQVGDELLSPDRLPFGTGQMAPDLAWLTGVHIADGWVSTDPDGVARRFAISGKDGRPKEVQKRKVQEICTRMGIASRWHSRYISVNDKVLASAMAACGHTAINKHVPSLDLNETTVRALLDGLDADSGIAASGTRVYSTINPTLALQYRVIQRMLGRSVHMRRVDKHGGLGDHPIYRVTVRNEEKRGSRPHPRVRAIAEEKPTATVDIETASHRFYLPESDLVVHNCDDTSILLGAMLLCAGYPVKFRVAQTDGAETWSHIWVMAGTPPENPTRWIPLDPTENNGPGWEVPGAQESASLGRPSKRVQKVRDFPVTL